MKIVEKIIETAKAGNKLPWQTPLIRSMNPVTGAIYKGVNRLLSYYNACPFWVTYKQIVKNGWKFDSSAKWYSVVFYEPQIISLKQDNVEDVAEDTMEDTADDTEKVTSLKPKMRFVYRFYNVTNLSNVIDPPNIVDEMTNKYKSKLRGFVDVAPGEVLQIMSDTNLEKILSKYGVRIEHNTSQPHYNIMSKVVDLGDKKYYLSETQYILTALHEIGHALDFADKKTTGVLFSDNHESRAYEEAVAEMFACFVASDLGLKFELERSVDYIDGWLNSILKNQASFLRAANRAEKLAQQFINDLEEIKKLSSECVGV